MSTDPYAQRIAREFSSTIREWLTPEEMSEVLRKQREEPREGVCYTHDYCDANEAMYDAFQSVMRKPIDYDDEEEVALWNEAWAHAVATNYATEE